MIKNLTTLKELEEFCEEQGLQFTKGERKGFIITLNKNIHIDKEICCGRYRKMSFKLVEYYEDMIVVVKSAMDDWDGTIQQKTCTYGSVIATFLYDYDSTLLIFRECNSYQECIDFYLSDRDRDRDND